MRGRLGVEVTDVEEVKDLPFNLILPWLAFDFDPCVPVMPPAFQASNGLSTLDAEPSLGILSRLEQVRRLATFQ
jgi:hypothetical protein